MKDCPKVSGLIAHTQEVRVPLSVFSFVRCLKIGTWNSCKWCNRSHAQVPKVFRVCNWWFCPHPHARAGKVSLPGNAHNKPGKWSVDMSEKKGHAGSCLCSCLIVLEAFICQGISWESGGNQIILVMFIDCSTPTVNKKGHLHAVTLLQYAFAPASGRCSDDKTIPLLCSLEMSTSALSSHLAIILSLFNSSEGQVQDESQVCL